MVHVHRSRQKWMGKNYSWHFTSREFLMIGLDITTISTCFVKIQKRMHDREALPMLVKKTNERPEWSWPFLIPYLPL